MPVFTNNITCFVHYMCLLRSLKHPIQQLVDITNITCIVSVI